MATFKVIKRPPPPGTQMNIIRRQVLQTTAPVVKQYMNERTRLTNRFKNRPEYESKINIRTSGVQILILLKNAQQRIGQGRTTLATLLKWLFKTGTKAHPIFAKAGKWLAFRWGGPGSYSRLTTGGSGQVRGDMTYRKYVNHPGFAPSPELDKVDKKFEKPLGIAIDTGYKIGHNRAKK